MLLGKAVKIANDSGNEATAKLLRRVVDVEDADKGTVRLKQGVAIGRLDGASRRGRRRRRGL